MNYELLKVNTEDNHVAVRLVERVGEFHHARIDEVVTLLLQNVCHAEAELQFGYELEVTQIDIATETNLKVAVSRLQTKSLMLLGGKIDRRSYTGNDIRTEVIISRSGKLYVERYRDDGATQVLRTVATTDLFAKEDMTLSEIERWDKTKCQQTVNLQFCQHSHIEARVIVVDICIPLLTRIGIDKPIITHLQVLHLQAELEAIVQSAIVQIRTMLHLAWLSRGGQGTQ